MAKQTLNIDNDVTKFFQSFVNLTERNSTTHPALTTVTVDNTMNDPLTTYYIYDQFAYRLNETTITPDIVRGQTLHLYLNAADPASYPGTGTTWTDMSTHHINGTLVGAPTFNSTYFTFNGSSTQYVDMNSPLDFQSFSVGAWVRTTASGLRMILSKETTLGQPWNYRVWLNSGTIVGDIARSNGTTSQITSPLTYNNNNWYLIMFTRDNSTKKQYLHVNGVQVATITDTLNGSIMNNQELWIGRSAYAGAYQFQGDIGQVFVYDKELTSSEILQNFNATKATYGY